VAVLGAIHRKVRVVLAVAVHLPLMAVHQSHREQEIQDQVVLVKAVQIRVRLVQVVQEL
jgi:hypothetical protein